MGDMSAHRESPPSAAGQLQPYGIRISLRPLAGPLDAAPFLEALLSETAAACVDAGATLIGHLKCALHDGRSRLFCNLTSARSGASCRGDGPAAVQPGVEARLDLAVLVYGLSTEEIDRIVARVLEGLLLPAAVVWSRSEPSHHAHR